MDETRALFLEFANDTSITAKYRGFLALQNLAVHRNALNAADDVGSVWYAPNTAGSERGPQASASDLEVVISVSQGMLCRAFDWVDQHYSRDPSMKSSLSVGFGRPCCSFLSSE